MDLSRVSCSCNEQRSLVACSSGETVTSSSSSSNSSPRTQRKDTRRKTDRRPAVKPPEPPEEPPPHIPVKGKVILWGQAVALVKFFWPFQFPRPPSPISRHDLLEHKKRGRGNKMRIFWKFNRFLMLKLCNQMFKKQFGSRVVSVSEERPGSALITGISLTSEHPGSIRASAGRWWGLGGGQSQRG